MQTDRTTKTRPRYIELDDVCHLNAQARGRKNGGAYADRLWRESYYFNFYDESSGYGLISTIGILPNRKLITGFFLVLKGRKIIALKPLIKYKQPVFNDYSFELKGLEYIIEGTNWRLKYNSDKYNINILFKPINKVYPYISMDEGTDLIFDRIGSQHLEQFGNFSGELQIGQNKIAIGPCFGHRDHSWGIRDWGSVDKYRLFCCAFSNRFAFNLWEGQINGTRFLKGYVFDGIQNTPIIRSKVRSNYAKNNREPKYAVISMLDEQNRRYRIECESLLAIPIPPRKSIMYETVAEMRINGMRGTGLLEYHYHENNPVNRMWTFLRLINML